MELPDLYSCGLPAFVIVFSSLLVTGNDVPVVRTPERALEGVTATLE